MPENVAAVAALNAAKRANFWNGIIASTFMFGFDGVGYDEINSALQTKTPTVTVSSTTTQVVLSSQLY